MKKLFSLFLAGITSCAIAQTETQGTAIMQPIVHLFTGMNQGDSAMVRSAFAREVTLATIFTDKTGKVVLRRESSLASFLKAVGTPHPEPWSEPIWETRIEVDGNLAQVWTRYAFYLGRKFSHCGIDAFQLLYDGQEWKIFHLADTRQTTGCQVPESISAQFTNR